MPADTQRRRELERAAHSADLFVRLRALHVLEEWDAAEFEIERKIEQEVAQLIADSAQLKES